MTKEEILKLEAGRELDVAIHRTVFGRQCELFHPEDGEFGSDLDGWYDTPLKDGGIPEQVPFYSYMLSHAWQVVEVLKEENDVFIEWWRDGEWLVSNKMLGFRSGPLGFHSGVVVCADTMPLAVCRAALLIYQQDQG